MLGNQASSLARVALFLLCSPILSPLEVVSQVVFDNFALLNEVRNVSHVSYTHLGIYLLFGDVSL